MSRPRQLSMPAASAFARLGLTFAVGLALDLWTKRLAVQRLAESATEYRLLPGWVHFTYVENRGAVFGAWPGGRWIFVAVSLAAILAVFWMFLQSGRKAWYQILLGMLMAGIVGNLYDRLVYAYVRDMIHALPRWGVFPWVFNVADSFLCISIGVLILHGLLFPEPDKSRATRPSRRSRASDDTGR